jgi:hypothetical protein
LGFITIIKALLRQDFRAINLRFSLRGKPVNILAGRGDDKPNEAAIADRRQRFHAALVKIPLIAEGGSPRFIIF